MAMTPYTAQQPTSDYGLRFAGLKYSSTLAASTATSLTIPGAAPRYKAVIKGGIQGQGQLWVAYNATATVPAGSSFAATPSEMVGINQKICREVNAGDTLSFITAGTGVDVSVVLYAVGTNN